MGTRKRPKEWVERYGPWAVVTGASSGIGRDMARGLADAGLNVVLAARRVPELEVLAAELGTAGVETRVLGVDLGRPDGVETLLARTADIDVGLLVAAAGFGTSGPFLESPLADESDMLAVNCRAVMELCWHFGRRLSDRGRGGIVLFSSIVAFQGVPNAAHYAATKAYIQTFAEGLRRELAAKGVDVLASAPGPTDSGFAARAGMRMGSAMSPAGVAGPTLAALGRKTTVTPGLLSKVLTYSLATLPRWGRVRVMEKVMGGMTKHRTGGRP